MGLHLYFKDEGISAVVKGWKVISYSVDKFQRQDDIVISNKIWEEVEKYISVNFLSISSK